MTRVLEDQAGRTHDPNHKKGDQKSAQNSIHVVCQNKYVFKVFFFFFFFCPFENNMSFKNIC